MHCGLLFICITLNNSVMFLAIEPFCLDFSFYVLICDVGEVNKSASLSFLKHQVSLNSEYMWNLAHMENIKNTLLVMSQVIQILIASNKIQHSDHPRSKLKWIQYVKTKMMVRDCRQPYCPPLLWYIVKGWSKGEISHLWFPHKLMHLNLAS